MQIADADTHLDEIVGQVLAHLLRQSRHERALAEVNTGLYFGQQVVDLVERLAHLNDGVNDPGRADDLLGDHARVIALVATRRGAHENNLRRD